MRRSPSCVPPYGVLEVGLTGDADGHLDRELGQSLAKLDGFLFVPAVEGFAQGERQFFGCTGSKGRVLIASPRDGATATTSHNSSALGSAIFRRADKNARFSPDSCSDVEEKTSELQTISEVENPEAV
ncbi:hypothetical protein EYF80_011120 [Liparis tanakae]|uniref:Uncharacterized protein n=1 Tax=Liparis tanakae TaxID=230148 RepID=A0A4Z2ILE4_9TELE|nr:hypothetical protein EYF80_011120 [Liparis tanakae]